MNKKLREMPLEELWKLFPIIIKAHNFRYKEWYQIEKDKLLQCLKREEVKRISHIGSTAIEGLVAKPTIDILLEVQDYCDISGLIQTLDNQGWILMFTEYEPTIKLIFNKGYTPEGFAEKVYHLHVRYGDDWDELYFRDYLLDHPDACAAYGQLKLKLWKAYEYDRDGYTKAKSGFIEQCTEKAKQLYNGRYKPCPLSCLNPEHPCR